jgi:uncharacterized OB-fold protein
VIGTGRPEPVVTERSAAFWTGGAQGELRIARCQHCGWYAHPPLPVCPRCRRMEIRAEPVSGMGTVWSSTVNRYRFNPSIEPPYVVALVELVEQPGLRLLTNVVGCDPDDVRIGMPVHVVFERAGDAFVPVFTP